MLFDPVAELESCNLHCQSGPHRPVRMRFAIFPLARLKQRHHAVADELHDDAA
jgi:hypothetical protein